MDSRECKESIQNYEFPCVRTWNRFHFHVHTHLKNSCSFKSRNTITNTGLIGCNKRNNGAPGGTHDARLLRRTKFSKILLQEMLYLTELLTWVMNLGKSPWYIWRYAFQSFAWLLKIFNKNTQYLKQRRYNKRLCSTIVCCWKRLQLWKLFSLKTAMLKGRFRIINKRCECKLENAK